MIKGIFILLTLVFVLSFSGLVRAAGSETPTLIDYALPYPGILPDSPIYFLKVARDRVVSFLILSSTKKAFYLLLLSDKRLAAGQVLVNTGKTGLGVTTIVNGEEYFSEALDQAETAKKEGKNLGELLAKMMVSVTKHEEVISELTSKVSGQETTRLTKAYENNQKSRSRVMDLLVAGH